MLPAQYRMTRSTDFGLTVSRGVRAAQPDLVVHALRAVDERVRWPEDRSGRLQVGRHCRAAAPRLADAAARRPRRARGSGARGQGGDPRSSEQPDRRVRPTRARTADRAATGIQRRGPSMTGGRIAGALSRAVDLCDRAVPHDDLPAAATVVPIHPDVQSVRGRRASRVRLPAGDLVVRGAAGQVWPVAPWWMGPDSGATRMWTSSAGGLRRGRG